MSPRRLFALVVVLLVGCSRSPQRDFDDGLAYFKAEKFSKAEACFQRALRHAPPTAQALNFLAVCQLHEGKRDEAIQNLQQALVLDPGHTAARQNLATALLEVRRHEAPIAPPPKETKPVEAPPKPAPPAPKVELPAPVAPAKQPEPVAVAKIETPPPAPTPAPAPTPPPSVKRRAPLPARTLKAGNRTQAKLYFNEGIAYQQQGKLSTAIGSYTKSVAADPSFAHAYYNLAIAYRDNRQPERALDNYELALLANPQFTDARFNYAILLQQEGYTLDALAQYEKILQDNPNDASVHLTVATLYAREKATKDKARQHYQAFLKLSPNSPLARDIRRWLDLNP
jgi:tetratricopeptide (TPR) repeat protein